MNSSIHRNHFPAQRTLPGFALVVTLSLMILLTLIAVGLLSLSAVSLRSSSQGVAQAEAQANARMALMLAIGELQKQLGPDQRVSMTADQRIKPGDDGERVIIRTRQPPLDGCFRVLAGDHHHPAQPVVPFMVGLRKSQPDLPAQHG